MSVDVGTAIGYLDLDTSGFRRGFTTAIADIKTFADSSQSMSTRVSALGSAFTSVGSTMTKTFTLPLAGLGTAAVHTAAQFESAMSEVKAISGATGADFDALNEKAKYMGATTKFSAIEAAEAMKYMGMAGWDAGQMIDGLEGIMNLAAASGEDLGIVSDIVTDALTAFGLQAGDAGHFADVLAAAATSANTNVGLLGESFKYVAPVAGALGYSVEDVSVALGLMANSGIKASQAGTSLRAIFLGLQGGVNLSVGGLNNWRIEVENADGSMRDLNSVMVDLREAFGEMTDAERSMNAEAIAGRIGMSGLLSIVGPAEEDFLKLSEAIYAADGTAKDMAETMLDNLSGQFVIIKSSIEGLAIAFGDIMMPAIKRVAEGLQNLLNYLNGLDDAQKEQIVRVAATVAAIGPALLILGQLTKGIAGLIKSFTVISGGLTKLAGLFTTTGAAGAGAGASVSTGFAGVVAAAGPVIAVIAAIAAAVVALKAGWDNNIGGMRDKIQEGIDYMKAEIGPAFESIKESITRIMGVIQEVIGKVLESIKSAWESDWGGMRSLVESIFSNIGTIVQTALVVITDFVKWVAALLEGDWATAWDIAKGIVQTIVDAVLGMLENLLSGIAAVIQSIVDRVVERVTFMRDAAVELIRNMVEAVITWFMELPGKIAEVLTTAYDNIVQWGTDVKESAIKNITEMVENVSNWFDELPGRIGYALGYAIQTVVNWLTEQREKTSAEIPRLMESISGWFKELPGKIKQWLDMVISNIIVWLADMGNRVNVGITTMINNVVKWFSELPGKIKAQLDMVISNVTAWVTNMITKAVDLGTRFVNSIVDKIKELPNTFKKWFDDVISYLTKLPAQFLEIGKNIMNGLFDGIKAIGENILSWFDGLWTKVKEFVNGILGGMEDANNATGSAGKSHAMGLDYVPHDNYRANLHEGERVLTKQENQAYSQGIGSGNRTYNFYSPVPITPVEARQQMKQAELEIALDFN